MKGRRLIAVMLALPLLLAGCTKESHYQRRAVVEGWIVNGERPVVILSNNVDISSGEYSLRDSTSILALWAKVSIVVDSKDTVILIGKKDMNYMPPYIYTTYSIRGEVGKTYELIVEYDYLVEKAVTTIPEPVELDDIYVEKAEGSDSLYTIKAKFDNSVPGRYYKFFTQLEGEESRYFASYLGDIDGSVYGPEVTFPVNKGDYYTKYRVRDENDVLVSVFNPYFKKDDKVKVRFSTLNEAEFRFWESFQNESYVSPLLSPPKNGLASNVTIVQDEHGPQNIKGAGCWVGYGSTFYEVNIADYVSPEGE